MSKRELHLGLMFWAGGTHPSGWRYPSSHAAAAFDIEFLQQVTQLVERAKFDFLFLGDRLASDPGLQTTNPSQMSRLEPFVSGASLAAATSHIGIVVTANPTYYDPYNLARMFASLDHLSQGRASWNLVTGADEIAAANFSREAHWDTEKRYDWADEFVTVVRQLWDSDASTPLHHKGPYFDVAGPLNIKRPPQSSCMPVPRTVRASSARATPTSSSPAKRRSRPRGPIMPTSSPGPASMAERMMTLRSCPGSLPLSPRRRRRP